MIVKLACQAPFNFDLSAKIFTNGDPQIQIYENKIYRQLISVDNKLILLRVKSSGTVDEPELSIDLSPDNDLSEVHVSIAKKILASIFNLDLDLKYFYDDIQGDPVLSKLGKELRGLKGPSTATFFEAIAESIVEQQISLKVANSMENRVIKKFGNRLNVDGDIYYKFPGPEILSKLEDEDLRKCGLSYRKASYIIGLSKDLMEGKIDLSQMERLPTDKIVENLMKIRGIGLWTAELAVIRGLHRLNALPADDVGIRRVVSHYYNNDGSVSSDDLRKIAEKWGKWSGLAVYYLIIADLMSLDI